eukprot:5423635-Pyramimonas_sp.AAC.1
MPVTPSSLLTLARLLRRGPQCCASSGKSGSCCRFCAVIVPRRGTLWLPARTPARTESRSALGSWSLTPLGKSVDTVSVGDARSRVALRLGTVRSVLTAR